MKSFYLTAVLGGILLPMATFAVDSMAPQVEVFNSKLEVSNDWLAFDGKFDNGGEIALPDTDGDQKDEIIVAAARGGSPLVQVYEADGKLLSQFYAYDKGFTKGIHIAAGDLNGDGKAEIITGPAFGGGPQVRVFNADGRPQFGNGFFAFEESFHGGVYVTVGDYNGDGRKEIAVGAGQNGQPHVRVFDRRGKFLGTEFRPFAGDDLGGVVLATANVDGGKDDELVMGVASAGDSWVKVYKNDGTIIGQWNAFPQSKTGVQVAGIDIDNDGFDEIAVTPRQNTGPQVIFFEAYGKQLKNFFPYDQAFRGGVRLAGGNVTGDKQDEIVTIPGKNHSQGPANQARAIVTDLSDQVTRVYEYGDLVKEFKISSGIAKYPSPQGEFAVIQKIYNKRYKHHYPDSPQDDYDLDNVKWNLRFNGPYFFHNAYWHNNFGHPMSHGCINIDAANAEWLYNWAEVGDYVKVQP